MLRAQVTINQVIKVPLTSAFYAKSRLTSWQAWSHGHECCLLGSWYKHLNEKQINLVDLTCELRVYFSLQCFSPESPQPKLEHLWNRKIFSSTYLNLFPQDISRIKSGRVNSAQVGLLWTSLCQLIIKWCATCPHCSSCLDLDSEGFDLPLP